MAVKYSFLYYWCKSSNILAYSILFRILDTATSWTLCRGKVCINVRAITIIPEPRVTVAREKDTGSIPAGVSTWN